MIDACQRPSETDAAHQRQVEEYDRAAKREANGGKPNDVCEPAKCLAYRISLWERARR